jgi:hypothetical protein
MSQNWLMIACFFLDVGLKTLVFIQRLLFEPDKYPETSANGKVVVKMDIEGAEFIIFPGWPLQGSLAMRLTLPLGKFILNMRL